MPGQTDRVRVMSEADRDMVLEWRNHDDVRRNMYSPDIITRENHYAWFAKASVDDKIWLLIFEGDGAPQGFVNFRQIAAGGIASWGFYLAPGAGHGMGQRLGKAALDFAFGKAQLHKICGEVIAFNDRSANFHTRLKFQQEGVQRQQHFDGTNYHDVICFGLLKEEWT